MVVVVVVAVVAVVLAGAIVVVVLVEEMSMTMKNDVSDVVIWASKRDFIIINCYA